MPLVEQQYVEVRDVSSLANGWDAHRELIRGHWVPADAVEWGVDEPWRPR